MFIGCAVGILAHDVLEGTTTTSACPAEQQKVPFIGGRNEVLLDSKNSGASNKIAVTTKRKGQKHIFQHDQWHHASIFTVGPFFF